MAKISTVNPVGLRVWRIHESSCLHMLLGEGDLAKKVTSEGETRKLYSDG